MPIKVMLTCFFGIVNDVNVCNCIAFFKKTTFREKFSTFYKVCWKLLYAINLDKYWVFKVFNILIKKATVKSYRFHTYVCRKMKGWYWIFEYFFKSPTFGGQFSTFYKLCWKLLYVICADIYANKYSIFKVFNILILKATVKSSTLYTHACYNHEGLVVLRWKWSIIELKKRYCYDGVVGIDKVKSRYC